MRKKSECSHSNDTFVHDIQGAVAKHYLENLKAEVKKGMLDKAKKGIYPGHAPCGYSNDKLTHTVVIDAEKSRMVKRMYAVFGTDRCPSVASVCDLIQKEFGVHISNRQVNRILRNPFYAGFLLWGGKTYKGKHPAIVSSQRFRQVQKIGGQK